MTRESTQALPLLRAGSVPYLNAAPLVHGLAGRLTLLPPSRLALALRERRIDAALLSVTEALLHDGYGILDGCCVASDGAVFSVFLAHRGPLEQVRVVHCDTASLTSVNLLRVLLAERGLTPEFRPLPDVAEAAALENVLLIGDQAIRFRLAQGTHRIWDLGEAWKAQTGLPFVYAAWVLNLDADTRELRRELRDAAARGQHDLEEVIRSVPDFDEDFRRVYLTRNTRHVMGPAEKAGIARFAALLRRHHPGRVYDPRYV